MNKVMLIGNLTRDPELQTTNSGVSVCRFSIAVQRSFRNNEGEREADFFNIVVWRALGENCHKYLRKGSKCAVTGRLQNSSYEASDGTKRYTTEVIADDIEFLTSKSNDGTEQSAPARTDAPAPKTTQLEPIDDDSLPF